MEVQRLTLKLIQSHNYKEILPLLKDTLTSSPPPETLPYLIKTISGLDDNADMSAFLNHPDTATAREAMIAELKHINAGRRETAFKKLELWLNSEDDNDNINGLEVVATLKEKFFIETVLKLTQHHNPIVKQAAFRTAGICGGSLLVDTLFNLFVNTEDENALDALKESGESCLPLVKNFCGKRGVKVLNAES